jgi:mRNA-degrading endonuclease RelE of RelBE toxin-antitoxin system
MNIKSTKSAIKDLAKYAEPAKTVIKAEIKRLKDAENVGQLGNVEKMSGKKNRYKLKKDDFRIVMEKIEAGFLITLIADRKEVYKKLSKNK